MEHQRIKIISLKKIDIDIKSEKGISKRNQFIYLFFFILSYLSVSFRKFEPENELLLKFDFLVPLVSISLVLYFVRKIYKISKNYSFSMSAEKVIALIFVLKNRFLIFVMVPITFIMAFTVMGIESGLNKADITFTYIFILNTLSQLYVLISLEKYYSQYCKIINEEKI